MEVLASLEVSQNSKIARRKRNSAPNLVSKPDHSGMAEGTRISKLDETVSQLKDTSIQHGQLMSNLQETTARQNQHLNDLYHKIIAMDMKSCKGVAGIYLSFREGLNQAFTTNCLVGGLNEEIRLNVKMFKPNSLSTAIGLARLQEEKIRAKKRVTRFDGGKTQRHSGGRRNHDRRVVVASTPSLPEISLHAIAEASAPQTMYITSTLNCHQLVILIDSGNTHSFLDAAVVKKIGVTAHGGGALEVMVGNGHKLKSERRCPAVKVFIQGLEVIIEFYIIQLGGYDAMLGANWLRMLSLIL
ncbi:hypothetical protein AMTR_s00033p00052000 [Amborella trichopoda]|uniref:Uncharacterized protein n=1 Tax=Amborella trichopoda TaxID=13333 RepID=U5CYG8_AMBTC|nr:hypothetical protein AMTR_s00033p00052000 [Amborella trichopoda]